jgi:hypothetical protein
MTGSTKPGASLTNIPGFRWRCIRATVAIVDALAADEPTKAAAA